MKAWHWNMVKVLFLVSVSLYFFIFREDFVIGSIWAATAVVILHIMNNVKEDN